MHHRIETNLQRYLTSKLNLLNISRLVLLASILLPLTAISLPESSDTAQKIAQAVRTTPSNSYALSKATRRVIRTPMSEAWVAAGERAWRLQASLTDV